MNYWKEVVIEALIVDCIYRNIHEIDPARAVRDLCHWEQTIALDPLVSRDARKLIQLGADQGSTKDLEVAYLNGTISFDGGRKADGRPEQGYKTVDGDY